jgi:hypothetical protein
MERIPKSEARTIHELVGGSNDGIWPPQITGVRSDIEPEGPEGIWPDSLGPHRCDDNGKTCQLFSMMDLTCRIKLCVKLANLGDTSSNFSGRAASVAGGSES